MNIKSLFVASTLFASVYTSPVLAEPADGLNVLLTSADHQTQLMAMVLSMQTIKAHNKDVNMLLCGPAGALALKETETPTLKPQNVSPTMLLKKIMGMGASVTVCPLYLPNANKTATALMEGITVANPAKIAGNLLNKDMQNLSY
ncbi:hypothetical protein [Marinomonas algarum]|uniref:DsrE/DsrF-like family protein n=1 Tax=Marinomonas algarum TaxID=2883105 RepID=A0A9X1RVZ5_9GAMM|nr:hypothetical protein [Marinomonas algarum]MCB5163072.1 hypothetical protein [Marinomonas algarum]